MSGSWGKGAEASDLGWGGMGWHEEGKHRNFASGLGWMGL